METGWLPDTPIDDNVLRQFLFNRPGFKRMGFLAPMRFTMWAR